MLYDFDSGGGGELSVSANETLTILRQDIGDGWWEARNAAGEMGLVPEAYLEVILCFVLLYTLSISVMEPEHNLVLRDVA